MRKNCTRAEKAFWQAVRNRNFLNLKFSRQYPIGFEYEDKRKYFIADFYCHKLNLIIEIDGGIHETQKDYDSLRTTILNDLGYHVIRFNNNDVLHNMAAVQSELKELIEPNPNQTIYKSQKEVITPSLGREGARG